jgi:hypothetical protein
MNKIGTSSLVALALTLGLGTPSAQAEAVQCHPAAKKLEWHLCITGPVEYKRGISTEVRQECTSDKIIKPKNGCDFGDLASYIPEGVELSKVRIYAIAPKDAVDVREFEHQSQAGNQGFCKINTGLPIEGWELMKFSEAFDKANYERARMVKEKLLKKKKELFPFGISLTQGPASCEGKSTQSVVVDRKSLSKYLINATYTFR